VSFICKNINCSAPDNKKGKAYPSAMECPFCDAPLVEVLSFSEADLKLINTLPYVIAYPLKRAITEKHAWTKINLLKDTFLNYLKYLGLLTASEFFNSSLKDKNMVALFQQALAEPSFGSWNQYIRETLNYLKENNHHFFCPDLIAYYELVETGKKRKLFKGEIEFIDGNGDVQLKKQEATAISMLINFRNRYLGHGLTLDEAASKKLWDEYYPIFSLLLEQLNFVNIYPMFKHEHGETYLLLSAELSTIETGAQASARVWMENPEGQSMEILPFFIVPGEVSLGKDDKEQILAYESYTGKTIKFFSPEGTEKQTSGKILEKLNLLLRDKQKEQPYTPDSFTKEVFINRIADENRLILDTLTTEKKYIPGVYVHREEMEIKLREWIGARANILFIAAEAGSGKTNLLIEMQKQYVAQNLPVLFIRAARMEKSSLRAQIGYLLNIQPELDIEHYSSIAGTQANPTFILIDGLNEAAQAESLWQEIIDISKKSIPGSLKFVVSSRANTSADLNGYTLTASDEVYLYGEKKEGHIGLSAYAFWLTALNMAEMKSAWDAYGQTNKNKYKPQFSFDDLATFDRSIYSLISNPLVLRIFLETYHNKSLPKKGNKHLNIWQDWLATFSEGEATFLKLLAKAVWEKGENEVLLDDLLNNPNLKPFLTSDLINAPYPRLKNLGWISRYVKDLNACVSFTVEGALLYLMGSALLEPAANTNLESITKLLTNGTKLQESALKVFLKELAIINDLKLVCELIDSGTQYHNVCDSSIIHYIRIYGVKSLIQNLFSSITSNDLLLVSLVLDLLENFQLLELKKELSNEIFNLSKKSLIKLPVKLKIAILDQLDYPENENLIYEIETEINQNCIDNIDKENEHKKSLAFYFSMNGFSDKALNIYKELYDNATLNDPVVLHKIAAAYDNANLGAKAKEYYYAALNAINFSNQKDLRVASMIYFNLANYEEDNYLKLEYYEKSLKIEKEIYGTIHQETSRTIAAIGLTYIKQDDFENALIKLNEALAIAEALKCDLSEIYNYYGYYYKKNDDIIKSLEYYEKSFLIKCRKFGDNSSSIIEHLEKIGEIFYEQGEDQKALNYFLNAEGILINAKKEDPDTFFFINNAIGVTYFYLNNYENAIIYFLKVIKIFNEKHSIYQAGQINNTYYYLGYSYYYLADYKSANNILNNLSEITIDSISKEDYINNQELIGNSFFHSEKYQNAIVAYSRIIPLIENNTDKIRIIEYLGSCYEYLEQYENAIINYLKCIDFVGDKNPENENIYWRIGYCQYKSHTYKSAIVNIERCFILNQHALYAFYLAKCFEAIENYDKTIEYFLQSAEIRNGDPEAGPEHESTKESIQNTIRVAKLIGKENELPEWIKKHNLWNL